MTCNCIDETSNLPEGITYRFEEVTLGGVKVEELVIEIINKDHNLTYEPNPILRLVKRPLAGEEACPNLHHLKVAVRSGHNTDDPLVYRNTGLFREGAHQKNACVYCVEYLTDLGEKEKKKRRRTNVTVSQGGGGGNP